LLGNLIVTFGRECVEDTTVILLSPELLSSQPFDRLLQNRKFTSRLSLLGIDEVHLVQDWGDPSLRDAFRHIALVHARMPRGKQWNNLLWMSQKDCLIQPERQRRRCFGLVHVEFLDFLVKLYLPQALE
jgi:hypothetical protein